MMTEFNPTVLFASVILGFLVGFAYTMWLEKQGKPEPTGDSLQPGFSYTFGYAVMGGLLGATYGMALGFMFYPIIFRFWRLNSLNGY